MYEYLKTKQTDSPKHSVSHSVVQQRVISDRNSYVGRFIKPEYYPIHETRNVVQMCLEEDSEEPEDYKKDPTFGEHKKKRQFFNSAEARKNLGETGMGGEMHHLIPGNVAKKKLP